MRERCVLVEEGCRVAECSGLGFQDGGRLRKENRRRPSQQASGSAPNRLLSVAIRKGKEFMLPSLGLGIQQESGGNAGKQATSPPG